MFIFLYFENHIFICFNFSLSSLFLAILSPPTTHAPTTLRPTPPPTTSKPTPFPTLPPTKYPTKAPSPSPTNSQGQIETIELVPTTGACPNGYTCMENSDFGLVDPNSRWKVDLVTETLSPQSIQAYQNAITGWQNIIIGDLESVSTASWMEDDCARSFPSIIDDMHICGKDVIMDGVSGILGSASVQYIRVSDGTVISGNMEFDTEDVQDMINRGTWEAVIGHEIGHILGLGSLWGQNNLVVPDGSGGFSYIGPNAINVWKNVWQCASDAPPVETDGGTGTAGAHWDEQCMVNEVRSNVFLFFHHPSGVYFSQQLTLIILLFPILLFMAYAAYDGLCRCWP